MRRHDDRSHWFTSGDIGQLLTYIRKQPHLRNSFRRLSLFTAECALRNWEGDNEFQNRAMALVQHVADGSEDSRDEWIKEVSRDEWIKLIDDGNRSGNHPNMGRIT